MSGEKNIYLNPKEKMENYYYLGNEKAFISTRSGFNLAVSTRDYSIFPIILKHRCWEPWIEHKIDLHLKPDMVAFDVGANYGYFVLKMSQIVGTKGKIIAFEPGNELFDILLMNIFTNYFSDRVIPFKALVGKESSSGQFSTNKFFGNGWKENNTQPKNIKNKKSFWDLLSPKKIQAEQSSFTDSGMFIFDNALYHLGGGYKMESVPQVFLDGIVPTGNVDFMLIDVEGFDTEVILGAKNIIQRNRNIKIIFEWNNENSFSESLLKSKSDALDFLIQEGFKFEYNTEYGHLNVPHHDPKQYADSWITCPAEKGKDFILRLPSGNLFASR